MNKRKILIGVGVGIVAFQVFVLIIVPSYMNILNVIVTALCWLYIIHIINK